MDKLSEQWSRFLVGFDIETTGVDVETSRIVSAAVVVVDANGLVHDSHQWLIDPGIEIPESASNIHGITTHVARSDGIGSREGTRLVTETLTSYHSQGANIVIFNAPFDLTILDRENVRNDCPALPHDCRIIDPYVIDKAIDPYRKGKRTLEANCQHYGVVLDNAHDALADAVATVKIAHKLATLGREELECSAEELHSKQREWFRLQSENYQNWKRKNGDENFTVSTVWPQR